MKEQSNQTDKLKNKSQKTNSKRGIDNLSLPDKLKIIILFSIIFVFLFLIMYRNSKINEAFAEINSIKTEISKVEKLNNQLEVSIQSSLNLYNVEQSAINQLGMQKLTNSQTIYIVLPKKDYIEATAEKVETNNNSLFEKIKDKIINFFK